MLGPALCASAGVGALENRTPWSLASAPCRHGSSTCSKQSAAMQPAGGCCTCGSIFAAYRSLASRPCQRCCGARQVACPGPQSHAIDVGKMPEQVACSFKQRPIVGVLAVFVSYHCQHDGAAHHPAHTAMQGPLVLGRCSVTNWRTCFTVSAHSLSPADVLCTSAGHGHPPHLRTAAR